MFRILPLLMDTFFQVNFDKFISNVTHYITKFGKTIFSSILQKEESLAVCLFISVFCEISGLL